MELQTQNAKLTTLVKMTLADAITNASKQLSAAGITNYRLDAEVLLCHMLSRDRAWLLAHVREPLSDERRRAFEQAIERRVRREPLQYITGNQEFWGLDFAVTRDVLIPRPETELIIEAVLGCAKKDRTSTIIDLCTGSGCIAVSLAKELDPARIFATDTSGKALAVARENAHRHGVSDRIRFLEGDLFNPLNELDILGQADIIVSNPPYIPSGDYSAVQVEVRDYEPKLALIAGPAGTEIHQRILDGAPRFLKSKGHLVLEMGIGQSVELVHRIRKTGAFSASTVLKDLAGIERVIVATIK
ncbi:MAG TPA: peptide chain release factor N(5)-glutamine methyltransferase [Nitrospirota bacterium]|nr:peptide chain release factor N(5)-glutamine methyltransferase [Nitrospirota bacterium]